MSFAFTICSCAHSNYFVSWTLVLDTRLVRSLRIQVQDNQSWIFSFSRLLHLGIPRLLFKTQTCNIRSLNHTWRDQKSISVAFHLAGTTKTIRDISLRLKRAKKVHSISYWLCRQFAFQTISLEGTSCRQIKLAKATRHWSCQTSFKPKFQKRSYPSMTTRLQSVWWHCFFTPEPLNVVWCMLVISYKSTSNKRVQACS